MDYLYNESEGEKDKECFCKKAEITQFILQPNGINGLVLFAMVFVNYTR